MSTPARPAAQPRPRYGRIGALAGATLTTMVSLLGAAGVIPVTSAASAATPSGQGGFALSALDPGPGFPTTGSAVSDDPSGNPEGARRDLTGSVAVPARSGEGRRVVMDLSRQRVWLVDESAEGEESVLRTYLVSGSLTDNLRPGSFEVFSRSIDATGIDGSSLRYMVRFTTGDNAAIGFHDIPRMDGEPMQTRAELGTPQSHGCVRQARPDARALWDFAPVGTPVVVTA